MKIKCENCCYFWQEADEDYPSCHYPYDDGDAPCEWEDLDSSSEYEEYEEYDDYDY